MGRFGRRRPSGGHISTLTPAWHQQGCLFLSGHSEAGEASQETATTFDKNLILLTGLAATLWVFERPFSAVTHRASASNQSEQEALASVYFSLEDRRGFSLRVTNRPVDALLTLTCDRSELLEALATRPVESWLSSDPSSTSDSIASSPHLHSPRCRSLFYQSYESVEAERRHIAESVD